MGRVGGPDSVGFWGLSSAAQALATAAASGSPAPNVASAPADRPPAWRTVPPPHLGSATRSPRIRVGRPPPATPHRLRSTDSTHATSVLRCRVPRPGELTVRPSLGWATRDRLPPTPPDNARWLPGSRPPGDDRPPLPHAARANLSPRPDRSPWSGRP